MLSSLARHLQPRLWPQSTTALQHTTQAAPCLPDPGFSHPEPPGQGCFPVSALDPGVCRQEPGRWTGVGEAGNAGAGEADLQKGPGFLSASNCWDGDSCRTKRLCARETRDTESQPSRAECQPSARDTAAAPSWLGESVESHPKPCSLTDTQGTHLRPSLQFDFPRAAWPPGHVDPELCGEGGSETP